MCVRAAVFLVCDVRSQFRTFLDKKGLILAIDFVHYKHIAVCAAIRWYSMFPIKSTVFLCSETLVKNTVRLIGNIEYDCMTVQPYGSYDSTVCMTVRFVGQYGLYDSMVVKLYAKFRLCI